jgi:outer membrane protein
MRKTAFISSLVLVLMLPTISHAIMGVELAVGGWQQEPGGTISYTDLGLAGTDLDLERDLGYDDEKGITGRLKLDTPLALPNIYLVGAPMEFEGTGNRAFNFGGVQYSGGFNSKLTLNQYDITLYYGIPLLSTASLGKLNIDAGLNVRIIDFEAEITGQDSVTLATVTESESETLPVPMVYLAVQVSPIEKATFELEARGITYGDNKAFSLIGRVKVNVAGPVFAAGGYRYEDIEIDEDGVIADMDFGGPFIEAGVQF